MEVKAVAKYMRISPRKVRILIDSIKGKSAEKGLDHVRYMPQKGARMLEKLIRSAVANADQNPNVDVDALVIKNIYVDQGPTLKRFRARARGRGSRILKRTSHITVILAERNE